MVAMPRQKTNVCEDLLLNKVVLRPDRAHSRLPESLGRPHASFVVQDLGIPHPIHGWYFPADEAVAVALVNPSNRGTRAEALDHAALLLECRCSVLLYDYLGFGDSGGLADVRTLAGSGRAVLDWADREGLLSEAPGREGSATGPGSRTAPPSGTTRLLLVGLSLGSLVAVHLAATYAPRVTGMVLDGAIEPFRALRRSFGPLGAAVAEVACSQIPPELNSLQHIASTTCPILFVHGRSDSVGTVEEMEILSSRAKDASLWILEDCDHLDAIRKHRDLYRQRLEVFLKALSVR
jgi:pimeloyl-ACP methyl ester carboxylesterase